MRIRLDSCKKPQIHFGVPIAPESEGDEQRKSRGVALIIAVLAVSMIMIFTSDMIVTSQVNLELAVKNRDNIKGEYMAKSALNLAIFLLSADWGLDLFLYSDQSPLKQAPADGPGDIWSMLNGLPIGGGTAELLGATQESFDLSAVNDDKVLDALKLFDGEFILNIEDEQSRINLNDCSEGRCTRVVAMLEALMSCPAEKAYLQEKSLEPRELVYRIKDWVDKDRKAEPESGFGDENDPYSKKTPSYEAKNVPFDSLDELRFIEGWDDDIHAIFSPYLTVYPYRTGTTSEEAVLNINTAPKELLGCLLPEAKIDCSEKFAITYKELSADASNLAGSKTDIKKLLQDTFCQNGEGAQNSGKSDWFDARSNVFRVTAEGVVGNQTRKLTAIIERGMPDKKKKIESSYRILYWKLI